MQKIDCYGYATDGPTSRLRPFQFPRRGVGPNDVQIDIDFCGVCHTDLHKTRNDWGTSIFPMVPGHEIVGRVVSVGENVTKLLVGDLAGVGCIVDSCRTCPSCKLDLQQYCEERPTSTYNSKDRRDGSVTYGGYSNTIVVDEFYSVKVPTTLSPAAVAPLLCAGITTYSALRHWNVQPGCRLGIVGLGGLGHMAIKFGKAFGAEVVLFTTSPEKERAALRLGAGRVILSHDKVQMDAVANTFDFILDTAPCAHDLNPFLLALKRDGVMTMVGPLAPLTPPVHSGLLVGGRKMLTGSMIGGIAETQAMLDFCARENVVADIELISIHEINDAFQRMLEGDVHHRLVIDMSTLRTNYGREQLERDFTYKKVAENSNKLEN